MSRLEKDKWTTSADIIISDIYEYDMKRGGLSIIKEKKLLPLDEINKIESMPKREGDIYVGNLERTNHFLRDEKKEGFKEYRLKLGEANNLTDDDIISVKKDAIFTRKYCSITQFGKFIEFREKNHYDAFVQIPKPSNLELYWDSSDGRIDVKGITDAKVAMHRDYLLKEISNVIRKVAQYDNIGAKKSLVKFMNDYKMRRLHPGYYRELNPMSDLLYDEYAQFDIVFNYLNILVPLLNII